MRLPPVLFLACTCALPAIAAEQTCKYIDDDTGKVLYSNVPQRNARKVFCMDPAPKVTLPKRAPGAPASAPGVAEAQFPRVDSDTQKRRDGDRRRILEDELAEEQRLLEAARQAVAEASQNSASPGGTQAAVLQGLRNMVSSHERNLAAIRRELSGVR